jgi:hypothetical protein
MISRYWPRSSATSNPTPVVAALAGPSPRERLAMLITGCLLIVGLWALVAIPVLTAGGIQEGLFIGALSSVWFMIVGAYVPLLFLRRTPSVGRTRRIAGLWAAGTSAMTAFLFSLLLLLEELMFVLHRGMGMDIEFALFPLAALSLVGPAVAIGEFGQFGKISGPQGRTSPLWLRLAVGFALLVVATSAIFFMVGWVDYLFGR